MLQEEASWKRPSHACPAPRAGASSHCLLESKALALGQSLGLSPRARQGHMALSCQIHKYKYRPS